MINVTMQDTAAPRSITSLQSTTGNFWINWTWTNPDDSDFGYSEVYIDNVRTANVSDTYYNGSYSAHSIKTISIKTVDLNGNVNNSWMNQTTAIPNNPVLLTNISSPITIAEGQTAYIDADAIDADGDRLTYSASGLPAGASFNTASGAFSWTPADGDAGLYVVTFEVTDGYFSDSETVTITVNDVNHAPVITAFVPADGSVFDETDTINIGVTATDADGHALTYTIKIDGVTQSSGLGYAWGTDYSSAGAHTIDITVSDGIDQVTERHIVVINNVHPRWDVNEDLEVNILDITLIGQKYGTAVEAPYPQWDVNQDGIINIQDLTVTSYYFGESVA
jgi:hypothetical protein